MYITKVKHKGQVTIPAKLRSKLKLREGTMLEMTEKSNTIIVKPLPAPKPGKPVGEEEYRKIISELDELRENWR